MIRKTMCIASLIIAILLAFPSCSNLKSSTNLTKKFTLLSAEDKKVFDDKTLTQSANGFGIDIFRNVSAQDTNNNVIISPVSMFTAFSLLTNGAGGETKSQMKSIMHIENYDDTILNNGINNIINCLNLSQGTADTGFKKIYNSVWLDRDFDAKDSFIKLSKEYYDSDIFKQDFAGKSTVDNMNGWISEKSGGLIKNAISEIYPSMLMTIFNVLHFKGKWDSEFDKAKTKIEPFYLKDGTPIDVNMMNAERQMAYYEDENVKIGSLSFNNRAEMLLMLPKADVDTFIGSLNEDLIREYKQSSYEAKVKLKMPSFNVEYRGFLGSNLQVLGMNLPFDMQKADFSGIKDNNDPLFLNEVLHDCVVKVNEEGAEAAALTALLMCGSVPPKEVENKELFVDRPFLFAIIDQPTNLILFVGKIKNPLE